MSAGGEIPRPVRKNQNDFSDALRKRGIEEVNTPWRAKTMTRNEYDEMGATANVALAGLLAGDCQLANNPQELVECAFDIAEAFNAEKKRRLGERPEWDN
ncbi:hypothetical protein [Pseudomonas aeruginosa]|uniref:hypothetical protein n=2 Tax=Pseudomonas aeruginosa TaxID=287 RepID=UPI00211A91F1|nr:hypothetical protein [Pseudomonas aeruginosa]MCS8345379.1 hypothetical protein [Pseudomonas aeruginosa]MCS8665168.1 hypothetical protein [Pseudomonas aeruginosa]MCS8750471.1 hypothetical protein [Pseudomonas aeruginosa]